MDGLTLDNTLIVLVATAKVAMNFWPVIAFFVGYCIWEATVTAASSNRVRPKSKNANYPYRDE